MPTPLTGRSLRRARTRVQAGNRRSRGAGFLGRLSLGALAAFAITVGAPGVASSREPPPCRIRCSPVSRTGCACGGHLYHCSGCGRNFHACIAGKPFTWICLRRSC